MYADHIDKEDSCGHTSVYDIEKDTAFGATCEKKGVLLGPPHELPFRIDVRRRNKPQLFTLAWLSKPTMLGTYPHMVDPEVLKARLDIDASPLTIPTDPQLCDFKDGKANLHFLRTLGFLKFCRKLELRNIFDGTSVVVQKYFSEVVW